MKRLARGFTLIEFVIALMLLALMTSVLFGSLQLAGRSWDSGEAKVARVTEMRQSQQFLREQITAAYPQRRPKVAEIPLLFSGERNELRYAAALPARVVEGGVLYFRLALAKDDAHSRLVLDRVLTPRDLQGNRTADARMLRAFSGFPEAGTA